jgi:cell division protein FtsI/penicillin-binding protein 2
MIDHKIPLKANRVLNLILVALLLILIRVWYLGVIQHDQHLELARKPQRRVIVERVERASIRDRFNIPLALNKIQYNAAVCFAQIRQIPSTQWKKDEKGKWARHPARSIYISQLSKMLADELMMDPTTIEDVIVGKACLFPHTPFVIKEDLSEEEYYRLRLLEKDWVGVQAQRASKRVYPLGKVACDILGYLGPISQKEYVAIAREMEELQTYLTQREAGELIPLPVGFDSPMQARRRLKELQEKAYTINDLVGKEGIEAAFDQDLRGNFGKKITEVDTKGNFIRELPGGRKSKSGDRILLTISSELQEFAEALLAQNESFRDVKDRNGNLRFDYPWIKGGAIVAMDPKSGEVLALASYPRIDPNDFVSTRDPDAKRAKEFNLIRWLESDNYAGEIWNGSRTLEREGFSTQTSSFFEEKLPLTWERYLELILPLEGSVRRAIDRIGNLKNAFDIQSALLSLLTLSAQDDVSLLINAMYEGESHHPSKTSFPEETLEAIRARLQEKGSQFTAQKHQLDRFIAPIPYNADKLLALDLLFLVAKKADFSGPLIASVGDLNFAVHRTLSQAALSLQTQLRTTVQDLYHDLGFTEWRKEHFKEFLKNKRKEEKEKKRYTRPYTEYLEQLEQGLFSQFWKKNRWHLIYGFVLGKIPEKFPEELKGYMTQILEMDKSELFVHPAFEKLKGFLLSLEPQLALNFLETLHTYKELSRPLFGHYHHLRNAKGVQTEKQLAAAFYPLYGFSYGRSYAFRQVTPLGSVFKIVTGYEGVRQKYESTRELNPLTLIDDLKRELHNTSKQVLGYRLDGQPILRMYKGGQMPRSSHSHIGRIDLLGALEQSSNIYFSILAAEHFNHPNELADAARLLGFGSRTGIELPGEVSGVVPDDLAYNLTGLYSCAIGQHSLVVSPLQTALMISAIANHGSVLKPRILKSIAGKEALTQHLSPFESSSFTYKDELAAVGISFPLFIHSQKEEFSSFVSDMATEVKRTIPLPSPVRNYLMEGMRRVHLGPRGTARPHIIRTLLQNPKLMRDYINIQHSVVGKTGTAEILYKNTIDAETEARKVDQTWFAAVSFPEGDQKQEDPELAVVVLLRFGEKGGKESAPLAMQMIKKWREIKKKHNVQ